MSSGEGSSSGKKSRTSESSDYKHAIVFSFDSTSKEQTLSNIENAVLMSRTLTDLGFQLKADDVEPSDYKEMKDAEEDSDAFSDDEEQAYNKQPAKELNPNELHKKLVIRNQKPMDLYNFTKSVAETNVNARCILLYFIAAQEGNDFITNEGLKIPLINIWKEFMGIKCPKIFIIQANVTGDQRIPWVLFNSEDVKNKSKTLPQSANMLLAYLPNPRNGRKSVAHILSEELQYPADINTVMTRVMSKLKTSDSSLCPKFSSTLIEPVYLKERTPESPGVYEMPAYSYNRKLLAYTFLFGQYDPSLRLSDLTSIIVADSKNLKDTFLGMGFELEQCVTNGIMTVNEFWEKLNKIVQDDEKMESCDHFFLILSSHGDENGILYAYDGCISLNVVWQTLCNCKKLEGKPKVLITDACRGNSFELPSGYNVAKSAPSQQKDPIKKEEVCDMTDVFIALACTEGTKAYVLNGNKSIFLDYLCKLLKKQGTKNFMTIMNMVMKNVAIIDLSDYMDGKWPISVKQQITFTSTLLKYLLLP